MSITGFILSALVGGLIGFLAGMLMKNKGFGHVLNTIIGLIGGFAGGCLFYVITLVTYTIPYQLIFAVVGAVLMMWMIFLMKRK
jgi:Transglycosylase associated protein.